MQYHLNQDDRSKVCLAHLPIGARKMKDPVFLMATAIYLLSNVGFRTIAFMDLLQKTESFWFVGQEY